MVSDPFRASRNAQLSLNLVHRVCLLHEKNHHAVCTREQQVREVPRDAALDFKLLTGDGGGQISTTYSITGHVGIIPQKRCAGRVCNNNNNSWFGT